MVRDTSRRLPLLAGLLLLVVLANGVGGLFALHLAATRAAGDVHTLAGMSTALDDARLAQVHFKRQVQEWKNVLLRGHDADDRATYERQFREEARQVSHYLARLTAGEVAAAEAAELAREHDRVMAIYEDALTRLQPGQPEAAFEADRAVRGVDRDLTERIDGYADAMQVAADRRRTAIVDGIEARYADLENWTLGGLAVAIILLGFVLAFARRRG